MAKIKFDWSLLENRSELGRKLLLERLVKQHKKSQLIAYALWLLFCGFGLHRMYLRQWRQAFMLIGLYFFVLIAPTGFYLNGATASLYGNLNTILMIIAIGVWLYEGVRLYGFVRRWNAELREEIKMNMVFV